MNYIVDGLNVCKWQELKTSLPILLTLLLELYKKGDTFTCIFDAVTPHRLREEGLADDLPVYQELKTAFSEYFTEVTGGIEADDIVLSIAHSSNSDVISNDRFRKNKYTDRYPWLESDPKRLIKGCVVSGNLIVSELSINVPVDKDSSSLMTEIQKSLGGASSTSRNERQLGKRKRTKENARFFPSTGQQLKHRSQVEKFSNDDELTLVRGRGKAASIENPSKDIPSTMPTASDLAKREKLLQEIKEFRAEDTRRRKAERLLKRSR